MLTGEYVFSQISFRLTSRVFDRCVDLPDADFALDIAGPVYAFDSRLIDLCLNVFWWAEFLTTQADVKIQTLIHVKTSIPSFVHITDGATHDVHGLHLLK